MLVALALLLSPPGRSDRGRGPARLAAALAIARPLQARHRPRRAELWSGRELLREAGSSAPPERSTDFFGLGTTRVDRSLSFADDTFPLYFFNDNLRFNYYQENEPDRQSLAFAVRWQGLLQAPSAATTPSGSPPSAQLTSTSPALPSTSTARTER